MLLIKRHNTRNFFETGCILKHFETEIRELKISQWEIIAGTLEKWRAIKKCGLACEIKRGSAKRESWNRFLLCPPRVLLSAGINPFKPEYIIVIFIHYKPWMKMIEVGDKWKKNCYYYLIPQKKNLSKTPSFY